MNILKFKKFISKLKSVSLSTQEKASLREDFLLKTGLQAHASRSQRSPAFLYGLRMVKVIAYSFLLFIVGIAPLTFAAESSNPGDLLYPLKVAVNEPVKKVAGEIVRPFVKKDSSENMHENKNKNDDKNESVDKNTDIPTNTVPEKIKNIKEIEKPVLENVDSALEDIETSIKNPIEKIDKKVEKVKEQIEESVEKPIEDTVEDFSESIDLSL